MQVVTLDQRICSVIKLSILESWYVCVWPPLGVLITCSMMWHDMDPVLLVKLVPQLLHGSCSQYFQ